MFAHVWFLTSLALYSLICLNMRTILYLLFFTQTRNAFSTFSDKNLEPRLYALILDLCVLYAILNMLVNIESLPNLFQTATSFPVLRLLQTKRISMRRIDFLHFDWQESRIIDHSRIYCAITINSLDFYKK